MRLLALFALVGLSAASYGPSGEAYSYHGLFEGQCKYDGLYYRDEKSFILCSNGIPYEQYCAPGSRNSGYEKFSYGDYYSMMNFCDINLVDQGYAVKHAPKKEEHPAPSFGHPEPTTTKAPEPYYEEPTTKAPEPYYEPTTTTTEAPPAYYEEVVTTKKEAAKFQS